MAGKEKYSQAGKTVVMQGEQYLVKEISSHVMKKKKIGMENSRLAGKTIVRQGKQ